MKFTINCTLQDFYKARKIMYRQSKTRWIFLSLGVFFSLILFVTVIMGIFNISNFYLGLCFVLAIFYLFYPQTIFRIQSYFIYKKNSKTFSTPIQIELSEDGVKTTSDYGNSALSWKAFSKFVVENEILLLYKTSQIAVIIPKKPEITDEAWNQVVGLLKSKLFTTNLDSSTPKSKAKVGWFFCGLSFIPLFGVLFGIIAIIIGAIERVKGQILLGLAGTFFTVAIYGSLHYFGFVAKTGIYPDLKIKVTHTLINTNAGQIALYKNQHGKLPEKLSELNSTTMFYSTDPWTTKFSYTPKSDGSFELRSAGPDKILNTSDDIVQTFTTDHEKPM